MKFRYKITCCIVSLLAIFYGIGGTLLISISFQSALEQEKENAHNTYRMILNTLQVVNQMGTWNSNQDISNVLEQLSGRNNSNWDAIRLVSTQESEVLYRNGRVTPYFQDVFRELDVEHCLITQFSDDTQKQYLQLSSYVQVGKQQMLLDVAYDISSIYESRRIQETIYYRIYFIMLAVCLLVVYMTTYLLTRPLNSLSKVTRHIASGNYAYRSMVKSDDEIGRLSEDFNTMAEQVENSVETMQRAMEQQEEFMGSFAHELKTPMTSIIGYADLIRRQTMSQEEEAEAANYIFTEGKRLEGMSFKLLELMVTKQKEITLKKIDASYFFQEVEGALKPLMERENVTFCVEAEEGFLTADMDLLKSVVFNLADNARKALADTAAGNVTIRGSVEKEQYRICVSDNGKGIPKGELNKITEAFYMVDKSRAREQGGAGLGLALCKQIMEIHHGIMEFEAQDEGGTRVLLTLGGGAAYE